MTPKAKMGHCYKTRYYAYNLMFMITILFMKFNYYDFTTTTATSVNKGFYTSSGDSSKVLRFRDFEPRSSFVKTDTDMVVMAMPKQIRNTLNNRKSRGFQFHADDKDVNIELEFIVPFVRIPIERSMDITKTAFRSLFDLNLRSILTTGAVVAVGGILAIFLKFFFSPFGGIGGFRKASRSSQEYSMWHQYDNSSNNHENSLNWISLVETKLRENKIDLGNCIQKSICEYMQKTDEGVTIGDSGDGFQKIIAGIISFPSVHSVLNGTAVKDAIDMAETGNECSVTFNNCNWNPKLPKKMFGILTKIIKYLNVT
ncbi:uncharacterized protein LOC142234179 [Haematobia irritans]|uniref:uncharacterized protein LOC142234179 n=1 Tax=Haematobia irritans TaxID=7368 RepID=UPI003F4FC3C4